MAAAPPVAGFAGFGPGFAAFFTGLAANQSKAWFEAHRSAYERDVKIPLAGLVADVSAGLRGTGVELWGDPKQSVFRIHRDVRFSHDKTPYKTHAGAVLTRSGSKKDRGLLYIHMDPAGSFLAGGFYGPEPAVLAELRDQIVDRPDRFRAVRDRLAGEGLVMSDADGLVRTPRGYEHVTEPDLLEALCFKSFVVRRPVAADLLAGPGLVDHIVDFGHHIDKLIAWGRGE